MMTIQYAQKLPRITRKLLNSCIILFSFAPFYPVPAFLLKSRVFEPRQQSLFGIPESSNTFDFSSTSGWDTFYQGQEQDVVEWHESIDFRSIAKLVPKHCDCLVIGCGNSALPRALYDMHEGELQLTCFDSSSACLDQLRLHNSRDCPRMFFVCGDATQLSETIQREKTRNVPSRYNVIVDKGLTDAILCGEGWNGPLENILREASQILAPDGHYLLVSYKLPSSTKEFLMETGRKFGLSWAFDMPESNDRVSVSLATKIPQNGALK